MMNRLSYGKRKRKTKLRREKTDFEVALKKLGESIDLENEVLRYYNYFYGAVRGFIILVVSLAILLVGFSIKPFLSAYDPSLWRNMIAYLQEVWVNLCVGLLEPVKLVKTGKFPDTSLRPKLIISNHVTDVDWAYLWMMSQRIGVDRSGSVKIIMKESMRYTPIFGWGLDLFEQIYLKRNWKEDQETLEHDIKHFCSVRAPLWIFLFPEGMTVNTKSIKKSLEWARKQGGNAPSLKYTLLPRARGFEHVLKLLEKYGEEPEIFDMTLNWDSYSGEIPTWEMGYSRERDRKIPSFPGVLNGTSSESCHMDSCKFSIEEVAGHPEGIQGWLNDRWERKDRLLEEFIRLKRFPGEAVEQGEEETWQRVAKSVPIVFSAALELLIFWAAFSALGIRNRGFDSVSSMVLFV